MPPKTIKGNGRGAVRLNKQKIVKSLSNGDIRRLARRGGIRRMGATFHLASKLIYLYMHLNFFIIKGNV